MAEEPLMVSVSLGATIPTGDYGNLKPQLEIHNVRLDQPLEPQLEQALAAGRAAWLAIDSEIEVRITEMLSVSAGGQAGVGVRERLAALEAFMSVVGPSVKNIAEEVRKHKAALEKPKKAKKAKVKKGVAVEHGQDSGDSAREAGDGQS
jgi:hypothetical protein